MDDLAARLYRLEQELKKAQSQLRLIEQILRHVDQNVANTYNLVNRTKGS